MHRQGWPFSGGLNILNFNTFGFFFFQKMNIFGGMKILWIFLAVITKTGLISRVISVHFRGLFLRSRYAMRIVS